MDPAPRSTPVSGGRHELVHRLAQGYLGGLWVARRSASAPGPTLALLRRITFTSGIPEEAEQRLAESAWDAMGIRHANVLKLSEVVHAERTLDVVYEYVDAQPLQSLMLRANIRRQLFPVNVALRVIADLLLGIEAMQRTAEELQAGGGFGGLSPESVLVTREGTTLLCDALVASTAAGIEEFGRNPAKLGYAAPEQLAARPLPPATDVFGCAVLLWELLAARRFLLGPRPALERRLREHQLPDLKQVLKGDREVAPSLLALIDRALAADPFARPAGPAELRQALLSCGQDVCDAREVARYFADLTGTASERRSGEPSLAPRSAPAVRGRAPGSEGEDQPPLSENTPVAQASVAPSLDKVAAWLDDEPTGHWTSRSSSFRPPRTGRDAGADANGVESGPEPSAAPITPPITRSARQKEKAEPSAAKPVALQSTVPRASSQPSLIPKVAPRALTPSPTKAAAAKATTQPLRLSKAAPKPASQKPPAPKAPPAKTITQPALPKAKAASLAPSAPGSTTNSAGASSSNTAVPASSARTPHKDATPVAPAVAVLTRPVLAIGEPLANPPPSLPRPVEAPPPFAKSPPSTPTLTGATPFLEPPPLPEPSPPPPAVTPTAPLVMQPSVVRHVVREIRSPTTKTPTVPVSPLSRSRSSAPPPHPPQPAEAAGFVSVPPAIQSARDSNIPGAPPAPVVEKPPLEAPPPPPLPQVERKLAASSRNKLLLVAALVLGVFMLILVLLRPAEPPWGALASRGASRPGSPSGEQKTPLLVPPVPAAAAPAAVTAHGDAAADSLAPSVETSAATTAGDAGPTQLAEANVAASAAANLSPPPANEPAAARTTAPAALNGPLPAGALDDDLLLAAFNFESPSEVTSCRQKAAEVSKAAAKKTPKSQLVLARRALVRGQRTRAHQILCEVSARDPRTLPLQRDLTDLALRIGDAEQAQFLAERSLGRSKNDPVLLGLWGDALAETRNVPVARRAWLSLLAGNDDARRSARLANGFATLGRRALKRAAFADSRRFFRRALILSQGDAAASLGYGESLLRLDEGRAALVWLERAARAFPKDSQAQLLLGEALYETGDATAARQAWKSAISLRPKDQKLRKRIARATRERQSSNN
jgi:eukaryotic-like serine/threonine-protein kinase